METYLNIPALRRFERRRAVASLRPEHFWDSGLELDDFDSFDEDVFRKVLAIRYGEARVSHWVIESVGFDVSWRRFMVAVTANEFEPIPDGCVTPILPEE